MKEAQDIEPTQSPKSKAQNPIKDDEIDLVELAKLIWARRRFIVKVTSIFFVLGLIIAFTSKVEYEATCKLLPESQEGSIPDLGGLGGLAGLAGFDMSSLGGSSSGVLTPELYPEIVRSTPFVVELLHTPFYFEKLDTTISSLQYFKYLDKPSLFGYILGYTIGLPGKIKSLFSSRTEDLVTSESNITRFSKEEWGLIKEYRERFSVSVEVETGIISVEAKLPDPNAVAQVTQTLIESLTERVINYKIEKLQKNLEFVKEQMVEAEQVYESRQKQLARFSDRNRNITTSMIQTEYQRLQNELNIAFEVYKGLATQLEQAKIKVKEETPVFTVLEPVRIPEEKNKPKRMLIVALSSIIGLFLTSSLIVLRIFLQK